MDKHKNDYLKPDKSYFIFLTIIFLCFLLLVFSRYITEITSGKNDDLIFFLIPSIICMTGVVLSSIYFYFYRKKKINLIVQFEQLKNDFYFELIDRPQSSLGVVEKITKMIKQHTQIDEVLVRLKEGNTVRFLHDTKDKTGNKIPHACSLKDILTGSSFSCLCDFTLKGLSSQDNVNGNITPYGSYYSNDLTGEANRISSDLKKISGHDVPISCKALDFKSMLLIPLKCNKEILGLLQLHSKQKNRFNKEFISFFEDLAQSMAFAIEQLRIGDQLRSQKEILQVIMENTPTMVAMLDRNMNYIFANKNWCNHFGMIQEQIIGKSYYMTYSHPIPNYLRDIFERVQHGHIEKSDDDLLRYQDGHTDWIRWKVVPWYLAPNTIGGIIYSIEIVSDRKKEQMERERFFKNSPDMICISDFDNIYKQVNPAFTQILGWTETDLIEKKWTDFLHSDDMKRTTELFNQIKIENGRHSFENRYLCKNGSYKWISWSFMPFYQEKEIFGSAKDVTHRKEMEKELIHLKQKADWANRSKSDFLANISHELRTPLSAIIGFTDLLQQERDQEKIIYYTDLIRNNGQHLLRTINDILDISKIEAGKMMIDETTPFNLKNEIQIIIDTMRSKVNTNKVNFEWTWDNSLNHEIYYGDSFRIKQIFINILGNSVKFTHQGLISLTVKPGTLKSELEFIFKDTGIGISKEKLNDLFKPFNQDGPLIAGRYGGTGLGLAITKKLIDLMKGSLEVSSEKGKGTIFTIRLNLSLAEDDSLFYEEGEKKPEKLGIPETITTRTFITDSSIKNSPDFLTLEASNPHYSQESTAPLEEKKSSEILHNTLQNRILVAEDDPSGQILMATILKKFNYQFDIVGNGEEVIEKLKEKKYSLILMDIQMPRLDGLETTKLIRKEGNLIPIVALTAHAMEDHNKLVLDAGMNGHLTKPIDKNKLKKQIDDYLQQ